MKKIKYKPRNRNKFVFIIINSILFSSLLVALITVAIIKSFELQSAILLSPFLFISIPLLASGIVSLTITVIASKNSVRELNELLSAIEKVSNGDFSVVLNEEKSKAMNVVFKSFNQMVNELNSIEILRNDFISSFSHEFKTPIVSIKGFAKLAQSPNITSDERNEYLNIIATEINRLSYLSSSTLMLTKLESQEIVLEKESYSLDEQIRQSILLFQKNWEEKNITLEVDLEKIIITNNKSFLSQVWINLIDNAIKFSNENTVINISLKRLDNNFLEVIIKDQGIGMSEETLKSIFNKFYQAEASRNVAGIGLGLSIVKRIIELCDGSIDATSELNNGTTFTIILPLK